MSVEDKLRDASTLLHEAEGDTMCASCKRKLHRWSEMLEQFAEVSPYMDETSERISGMDDKELAKEGGKVAVLYDTVLQAQEKAGGNLTDVREHLNSHETNVSDRGSTMDKSKAMQILGGSLVFGTGLGYVLDVVDAKFPQANWYMRVGPAAKVLGGAAIALLGIKGKVFKGEKLSMMAVAGGSALMSQGALNYIEMLAPPASILGTVAHVPGRFVNARAPGQLPIRVVEQTRAF